MRPDLEVSMFIPRYGILLVGVLLAPLLVSSVASADSKRARISGTVTDANSAPVANVKVTVTAKDYPVRKEVYTGRDGKFAVVLPHAPVWCQFRFARTGFRSVTTHRMVPVWSTDHEVDLVDNAGFINSAQMSTLNVRLTAQESSASDRK
jgi:hypothetical protein